MKLQLMIEASPSVLAGILANLPDDGSVAVSTPAPPLPVPAPAMPAPPVSAAPLPPPMPSGSDGDDADGPVNADAPLVDSTGLPWDERIHAKSKATNADGSWRGRRGADKDMVAQIERELRGAQATPAAPAIAPPPPPPPAAPVPAPVAPPAPVAAPAPPPPAPVPMTPIALPTPPAPAAPPPMPVTPSAEIAAIPPLSQLSAVDPAPIVPTPASPFAAFMQNVAAGTGRRDANGAPVVHAQYLADLAKTVGEAFQSPLMAITDMASHPRCAEMVAWAQAKMEIDGTWTA